MCDGLASLPGNPLSYIQCLDSLIANLYWISKMEDEWTYVSIVFLLEVKYFIHVISVDGVSVYGLFWQRKRTLDSMWLHGYHNTHAPSVLWLGELAIACATVTVHSEI